MCYITSVTGGEKNSSHAIQNKFMVLLEFFCAKTNKNRFFKWSEVFILNYMFVFAVIPFAALEFVDFYLYNILPNRLCVFFRHCYLFFI